MSKPLTVTLEAAMFYFFQVKQHKKGKNVSNAVLQDADEEISLEMDGSGMINCAQIHASLLPMLINVPKNASCVLTEST